MAAIVLWAALVVGDSAPDNCHLNWRDFPRNGVMIRHAGSKKTTMQQQVDPGTRSTRHPLPVRLFHWINALSIVLLLMSGLQIFNSYPRLQWGYVGYSTTPAFFEISGNRDPEYPKSWIQIAGHRFDTTGLLGRVRATTFYGVTNVAFPRWITLPSGPMDLGGGRAWHFLMIWVFFLNAFLFAVYGMLSGRFWRDYIPRGDQLAPRAILQDLSMHLRFERASGLAAAHYNLLQRLAYSVVLFVLMPMMVLSGMTMSPSATAAFPGLLEIFHGRQTARSLHFIVAGLLVLFLVVHVIQTFVGGFVKEMRSIITGVYINENSRHG